MDGGSFTDIADYLRQRRSAAKLSQDALAEALAATNEAFDGVDGLAISRWERGKVSPSLLRLIGLMRFFDDEPHLLLSNRHFDLRQLPSLSAFHKWTRQNLVFNHVMGGHPYVDDRAGAFDVVDPGSEYFSRHIELASIYIANLTRGRERWPVERLAALAGAGSSHSRFFVAGRQVLGHLILLRISEDLQRALLNGERDELSLEPADLLPPEQPAALYALSAYFGSRAICEDGMTQAFRLLAEDPGALSLGLKVRANFGVKLMELAAGELVARGPLLESFRDGARYQGKYYEYLSYSLSSDLLLSNPTFLGLARQLG